MYVCTYVEEQRSRGERKGRKRQQNKEKKKKSGRNKTGEGRYIGGTIGFLSTIRQAGRRMHPSFHYSPSLHNLRELNNGANWILIRDPLEDPQWRPLAGER